MDTIHVYMLRTPQIFFQNKPVVFPYKKAEALFYYLVTEKVVTRDVAASLLWEDTSMETARKNLRNALYMVKKIFGQDIIVSTAGSTLSLNSEVPLECDLDLFLSGDTSVYQSEFLSDFFIKKADSYEEWLQHKRDSLENIYLVKLYEYIKSLPSDSLTEIELTCSRYMEQDTYDERIVHKLMSAYRDNQLYLKAINAFQKLKKGLEEELGIVPGPQITKLYHTIRSEWADSASETEVDDSHIIQGRIKEAALLHHTYEKFQAGEKACVVIDGEPGIGKTYLLENLLNTIDKDNVLLLKTSCFASDFDNFLVPWNSLILQLDTYLQENEIAVPPSCIQAVAQLFPTFCNQPVIAPDSLDLANTLTLRTVQNGIYRIINQLAQTTPVLMVFDNLQFADPASVSLLISLLRDVPSCFCIMFTCPDTASGTLMDLLSQAKDMNILVPIHLRRFSRHDMEEIIASKFNIDEIPEEILEKLYKRTSGNAFFLNELLTAYKEQGKIGTLSDDAINILSQRLSGLSSSARQILDIISLFHDYVSLQLLEQVTGQPNSVILELIEELKTRALIQEETADHELHFMFNHGQMRHFVRKQLSPLKQRILYNRIASVLEESLPKGTSDTYAKLVHYFQLAENEPKVLMYQIYPFENLSISLFELYPSRNPDGESKLPANLSEHFSSLEQRLEQNEYLFESHEIYLELQALLFIGKSRYYILSGLYCEGMDCLNSCFSHPYILTHPYLLLRAYRQMVYYGIQMCQPDLMKKYLDLGIRVAQEHELMTEQALFYRLLGLHATMIKDYDKSQGYLLESINMLKHHSSPSTSNILNIAAAYNYLGEVFRKQKYFGKAIRYYKQAIDLCVDNKLRVNPMHYTNLARAYFALGQKEDARQLFETACILYDQSFTLMERSVAYGYHARFCADQKDFAAAASRLKEAVKACSQLGSPVEKGLLRCTQYHLKKEYPEVFSETLPETADFYRFDAVRLLSADSECNELEYL